MKGFCIAVNAIPLGKLYFQQINLIFLLRALRLGECNYDRTILLDNVKEGEIETFVAKRIMNSHMSIDTLLDMLKANDLRQLRQVYLLHISERNGNAESFKERIQRLTGAEVYVCY